MTGTERSGVVEVGARSIQWQFQNASRSRETKDFCSIRVNLKGLSVKSAK